MFVLQVFTCRALLGIVKLMLIEKPHATWERWNVFSTVLTEGFICRIKCAIIMMNGFTVLVDLYRVPVRMLGVFIVETAHCQTILQDQFKVAHIF